MPNFDRTGPRGQGPMTGRGFGPCGCGFAYGFGRRNRFRTVTEADEKKMLQEELETMKEEKAEIEKRLKELKA